MDEKKKIVKLREKLNKELQKGQDNHVPSKKVLAISKKMDELVFKYHLSLKNNEE